MKKKKLVTLLSWLSVLTITINFVGSNIAQNQNSVRAYDPDEKLYIELETPSPSPSGEAYDPADIKNYEEELAVAQEIESVTATPELTPTPTISPVAEETPALTIEPTQSPAVAEVPKFTPEIVTDDTVVQDFDPVPSFIPPQSTEEPQEEIETQEATPSNIPEETKTPDLVPTEIPELTPTPTPMLPLGRAAIVDANAIIVYDFSELKTYLGGDNTYTTIYIGANITLGAGGIVIPSTKNNVIIDGCPPGSPDGMRYKITDYNSLAATDTIAVRSSNKNVTVRNLIFEGRNYYGIIFFDDPYVGCKLTTDHVEYTGTQMIYNPYGTLYMIDSSFTQTASTQHEVGEIKTLILEGNVTINHLSAANSVFWFRSTGSSITVADNANVNITSNHYIFYVPLSSPPLTIGRDARLNIECRDNLTHAEQLESLYIDQGGSFTLRQMQAYSSGTIRIRSTLTLQPTSTLIIIRPAGGYGNIWFTQGGATATFNNPRKVLLYSPAFSPIYFTGTGNKISIAADTINLWRTASLGTDDSINNMPLFIWNKKEAEPVNVTATFATTTTPNNVTHNLTGEDPITDPLNIANFTFTNARLITFGQMRLDVFAENTNIYGTTMPEASVRVTYDSTTLNTVAHENGQYIFDQSAQPVPTDTIVNVLSHSNHLKMRNYTIVLEDEDTALYLQSVPGVLDFSKISIPSNAGFIPRTDQNWTISVWDGRGIGKAWRLDASISAPLSGQDGSISDSLTDALVFVDESSTKQVLSSDPLTVFNGVTGGTQQTDISWAADKGILLYLTPGVGIPGLVYTTTIQWSLYDTP